MPLHPWHPRNPWLTLDPQSKDMELNFELLFQVVGELIPQTYSTSFTPSTARSAASISFIRTWVSTTIEVS